MVSNLKHLFDNILAQKISPEGKPKVQLQVCLHDGDATTFQFVNPAGITTVKSITLKHGLL